jgi:UDP-2,3-diacylglucosamine hydrolase
LTKAKTYFVSDVHLGAPAMNNNLEREKLFVAWLNHVSKDAEAIYLLGDIFDFWYEYKKVVPRGFVRTLAKIAEITDSGIPVHYFTGNHDVWVFDYLPTEIGITIHYEPIITQINNKKFFLGHGDGLDPNEKGYLMLKRIFTSRTAQFFFTRLHPNMAFWFGHQWAKRSRLAKGTKPEVSKGSEYEKNVTFAKNFIKQEHIDFFVFGHRHVLMNEQISDNTCVVMLGEWFNYFSYAVFDGEKMELNRFN